MDEGAVPSGPWEVWADNFLDAYLSRIVGSRDQQGLINFIPFTPPSRKVQPRNSETHLSLAAQISSGVVE